ncbi:hypothetical protein DH09_06500 [Bacillaceae bacterium JMAK1]|nr:hypothetical protein DH09_06500 [Bacillaceae bacterium JMAK1]
MTAELNKLDELKQSLPFGEQESWRLQQLENKLKGEDVFSVAICGHFSAGKSTLINQLLGANLLPSSPVPTTANIMTIQGGEETAIRAIKNNGQEEQFQGHIPWEKLQQLALDGDGVKEIVLTLPLPFLKRKVTLADTPGMDSTDPTHGRYTANQLLTTDAIIYVTDYNHVRSQTNLQFLKQLQRENKPFVIVVNQIDKHNDDELSFSIFKHGLLDMLQRYGIKPVKVFTTSARAKDHPYNELESFINETRSWLFHSEALIDQSQKRMLESAVESLRDRLFQDRSELVDDIAKEMERAGYSEENQKRYNHLQKERAEVEGKLQKELDNVKQFFAVFYKQTNLFPHDVTERMKEWLRVLDPSFKVGFFGSKKKKKELQDEHFMAYYELVKDRFEAEIRLYLMQRIKKERLPDNVQQIAMDRFEKMELPSDSSWYENFISSGEKNDQYVYQLAKQLNQSILTTVKRDTEAVYEALLDQFEERKERAIESIEKELASYEELEQIEANFEQQKLQVKEKLEVVEEKAVTLEDTSDFEEQIQLLFQKTTGLAGVSEDIQVTEATPLKKAEATEEQATDNVTDPIYTVRNQSDYESIKETLVVYRDEEVERENRKALIEHLDAFSDRTYSVVVAGAFSAGKSTFLNALLQADLMPSSPHPTTASLTVVKAPTIELPHETVTVQLKSRKELEEEVEHVAYLCGMTHTLESLKKAEGLSIHKTDTLAEKQWVEYLRALQMGVKKDHLEPGSALQLSLSDWQEMAVDESEACLIDYSHVYYNSTWTDAGFELIDTPGVQSVHERHTQLAMNEIAKADAFLYLMYYHHAYSDADAKFMEKIKQIQSPDYVLINASDLAHDEAEREAVEAHVVEQLKTNEHHDSIVASISSKQARKSNNEEGIASFLQDFDERMEPKLQYRAQKELDDRLGDHADHLTKWLQFFELPKEVREKRKATLTYPAAQKQEELQAVKVTLEAEDVNIRSFAIYSHKRLVLQWTDELKKRLTPAVFQSEQAQEREESLREELEKWLEDVTKSWQENIVQENKRLQTLFNENVTQLQDVTVNTTVELQAAKTLKLTDRLKEVKVKKNFLTDEKSSQWLNQVTEALSKQLKAVLETYSERVRSEWNTLVTSYVEASENEITKKKQENEQQLQKWLLDTPPTGSIEQERSAIQTHLNE